MIAAALFLSCALDGQWQLNVGRSHYGGGAERRVRETFACRSTADRVQCTISSDRENGVHIEGVFSAAFDGRRYPATGIPDVDRVAVRKIDDHILDATFSRKGSSVFAYRAVLSDDRRSLTIIAVDPVRRAVLNSVIVYDRQ